MPKLTLSQLVDEVTDEFMIEQGDVKSFVEAFHKYDADGSGDIDAAELSLLLADLGQHPTDREIQDMVRVVDRSGSGIVSLDSFLRIMCDPDGIFSSFLGANAASLKREDPRQANLRRKIDVTRRKLAEREFQRDMHHIQSIEIRKASGVTCVGMSCDGCYVAAGSTNVCQVLRREEYTSGDLIKVASIKHPHIVNALAWTQDARGPVLATCCVDRKVRVWRQEGRGLLEVCVRACTVDLSKDRGVSTVTAAISVAGVTRIGKSRPAQNVMEWDSDHAMPFTFEVPDAGTDIDIMLYLDESKDQKPIFIGKDREAKLLDRVMITDNFKLAGFMDPSRGRVGTITDVLHDLGPGKECLISWDIDTGATSEEAATSMAGAYSENFESVALGDEGPEEENIESQKRWPSRSQESALPTGLPEDLDEPKKNVMYSLKLASRAHASARIPVLRAVAITELSSSHGGGGGDLGKGGDWFETRLGSMAQGKVSGSVMVRSRWIEEPNEWQESACLVHDVEPTGLAFHRGVGGSLMLVTAAADGVVRLWMQSRDPHRGEIKGGRRGEFRVGRRGIESEWECMKTFSITGNVRCKGLVLVYGELPDQGIYHNKTKGEGKVFKIGMRSRRDSWQEVDEYGEGDNSRPTSRRNSADPLTSLGEVGEDKRYEFPEERRHLEDAEVNVLDIEGDQVEEHPGMPVTLFPTQIEVGVRQSSVDSVQPDGSLVEEVNLEEKGVHRDTHVIDQEAKAVKAAKYKIKLAEAAEDEGQVSTTKRCGTSREWLDKTLRRLSKVILVGDDKNIHIMDAVTQGEGPVPDLVLTVVLEGAGVHNDDINFGASGTPKVCLCPRDATKLLVSSDNYLQKWDISEDNLGATSLLREHVDRVRAVAWRQDARLLASGDQAGVLKVWAWSGDKGVYQKQKESMGDGGWRCVKTIEMSVYKADKRPEVNKEEEKGGEEEGMHDCLTIAFGHGPAKTLLLVGGENGFLSVFETQGLAPLEDTEEEGEGSLIPWGLLPGIDQLGKDQSLVM